MEFFERTGLLLGDDSEQVLQNAHVLVLGMGGVGSYAVEALARAGIGHFTLIDNDVVAPSNINRQLVATQRTIGRHKVDVAKERILDINPNAEVRAWPMFYLPEKADALPLETYDYIVDAIDTTSAKVDLICRAYEKKVPIICAMGCGNKLDPTRFTVTDLFKTTTDPLARILRSTLRKRGVKQLKVVYSTEPPHTEHAKQSDDPRVRPVPGSVSFVPSVAGLILAGEVIKDITGVR